MNSRLMTLLSGLASENLKKSEPPIAACLTLDEKVVAFGRNQRVPLNDPTAHAEMICLRKVGRLKPADFRRAVLYTTLSPCWMCSGTILLLGIRTVVVGESSTFRGPEDVLKSNGVQIFNLEHLACKNLMREFQEKHAELWKEDVSAL